MCTADATGAPGPEDTRLDSEKHSPPPLRRVLYVVSQFPSWSETFIVREIRAGVAAHPSVAVIHDRRAAIRTAVEQARPGDVVLVAGKGHESEQIVGTERRPFSDRAVALELLRSAQ